MKARPPSKALVEKRARLVRLLEGHRAYLAMCATLTSWTPPPRVERPRRGDEAWPYRQLTADRYHTPRTKPELAYPLPGAEAISGEAVRAYIEADPFVRGGLSIQTVKALCYIESFASRRTT